MASANPDILNTLVEQLKKLCPEKTVNLNAAMAGSFTLKSFDLDSLDTLQLAMELEEALDLEIEIVNFSESATLVELANQLSDLRTKSTSIG